MRASLSVALLCLSALVAAATPPVAAPVESEALEARIGDPFEERLAIIEGLRDDDFAKLIGAQGEEALRGFLSVGADEADSVAAKIAEGPRNEGDERMLRIWTTLAGPDGVTRASAELYPMWQRQLPQMLAGAQAGLALMGQRVAEDKGLGAVERAQMLELQFALTSWLARTDFGDRKRFDEVLGHARAWILASGKAHPLELSLTAPEHRLELAARALRSAKQVASLYGFDAEATLRSVRIEKVAGDAGHMTLRWSLRVLEVPLVLDERLALHQGMWLDADVVQSMQSHRDEAPPLDLGLETAAPEAPAADWENPSCRSPD